MVAANKFGFNFNYYRPLQLAILKGDWESTKAFIDLDPSALTAKITYYDQTALHFAAMGGQWKVVEKLAQLMPADMVVERDSRGCTGLHYVATGKSIDTAKTLVAKNSSATQIDDSQGLTPIGYSIVYNTLFKEMIWFLVLNTLDDRPASACPFSALSTIILLRLLTTAGFHDITVYILERYPYLDLVTLSDASVSGSTDGSSMILHILSRLPSHFQSEHKLVFWKRFIYNRVPVELQYGNTIWNVLLTVVPSIKLVRDAKLRHVSSVRLVEFIWSQVSARNDNQLWGSFVSNDIISNATSSGIVEILRICFEFIPDLIWTNVPNEGYVAQIAVKNRQERAFRFLCKNPTICKMQVLTKDESNNTTTHLAAKFASQVESIPGAAFQMQRELQWFKEIEKLDCSFIEDNKNQDGKTAWQVFKEEHKELLKEGKDWMKDTSNSCMLVATLIATIAFAAAITVPGGNNQDKGMPVFLSDNTFVVFVVSDALALFSSMASLLMFLGILNARFSEEDFLVALPQKLIIGLAFLFLAIVSTMVSFGASLSMLVQERLKWAPIPIALLTCVPIALFAKLQLPLFIEMITSTYGSRFSQ
ncbi:hypothetical protein P8452_20662 [Trifolium repens]|nr:hypothetical protein P8452_20662 [Trifolium repens]